MPTDRLRLRVLGPPALFDTEGEPVPFRVKKHLALLAYLALDPGPHRRGKLADLLWPSAREGEARHSLSTALSVLRAKLGRPALEATGELVRLVPGAVELDLDRLTRGEIHATDEMPALDVAPLLQDFHVPDAQPWAQWRDAQAARWQPAIRGALLARIDRSRRQGNSRAMEILADALLALDELSEDGIRAKMESRAFAGDRLTALRLFEDWKVRLATELGAQPGPLVEGMALRLRRRGWERTSELHVAAVRTDQWKDRPFIGRAREYQVLYEGWEGCEKGTPRHAVLVGESGVGKTTLVDRVSTAAGLQGAVAVRAQGHEVEREIPFGVIGALVTALLERPGATAISPDWLGELGRTVNAVRRRFPNAPVPPEVNGETARIRFADALHELVRVVAEEQPLILVLEDAHLADDASVAMLHLLIRRLTDERALVLCTMRTGERAYAPSAQGLIERAELFNMAVVPVPPFTEAEAGELLDAIVAPGRAQPSAVERRALLRAAAGLPMLLELLVRDWEGHGEQCVALALEAMTEEPGVAGGAGAVYRRLTERITAELDPVTRGVLNLAAILGSQLNDFALYGLVDLTLAQAMMGLSRLASLKLLRDGGRGLEFANEVLRGEAYLAIPSTVRRLLHGKVADRLLTRQAEGEPMLGLAIAWHCMRSGRKEEAGEQLIRGGNEAIARSALVEAETALRSGVKTVPVKYQPDAEDLLLCVLVDQGRYTEAKTLLPEPPRTADTPQALMRRGLLTIARAGATTSRSASTHFDELEGLLASTVEPQIVARTLQVYASMCWHTLDQQRHAWLLQALDRVAIPAEWRAALLLVKAQALCQARQLDEAEALLTMLAGDERKHLSPAMHGGRVALGVGVCRATRGRYEEALSHFMEAQRLAVKAGAVNLEMNAYTNCILCRFRLGKYEEVRDLTRKGPQPDASHFMVRSQLRVLGIRACAEAELGLTEELSRTIALGDNILTEDPDTPSAPNWWLTSADALYRNGNPKEALRRARLAIDSVLVPAPEHLGQLARWCGLVLESEPSSKARNLLVRATESIQIADCIDRVEIATAALTHRIGTPESRSKLLSDLPTDAAILPAGTVGQLERFGAKTRRFLADSRAIEEPSSNRSLDAAPAHSRLA